MLAFGNNVQLADGTSFTGIAPGSTIYIGGNLFVVGSINSPTSLSTTTAIGTGFLTATYLAEYGGIDGNEVKVYFLKDSGNYSFSTDTDIIALSGGNSDDVVWRVSLNFSDLLGENLAGEKVVAANKLRQAWLTFAPQLANSTSYTDTEWTAIFSNWMVNDPNSIRKLQCAAPGSVRIDSEDTRACVYSGTGWQMLAANNYQYGFAQRSSTAGNSVTLTYQLSAAHDLYLGTALYPGRATVSVSLDGDAATLLTCNLDVSSELVTRRLLRKSLPAGTHHVTITLTSDALPFVFDYVEAAIPGDFPDAAVTYDNVSPALDYDTDATYKVSPQRLMWHLNKLGFRGHLNEYLGVFWWNQRVRASGYKDISGAVVNIDWRKAIVNFTGPWTTGETLTLRIGSVTNGQSSFFAPQKAITATDTNDTIAAHFLYYINAASVSMWAEITGPGQLTVHTRTPNWGDDIIDSGGTTDARIQITGDVKKGTDGIWIIDAAAANPINFPFRTWHADFFSEVKNSGLDVTTSFSMELVYPPDDDTPGNEWEARYADGRPVRTDTGFSNLLSSQCAPIPNLTNYQKQAFKVMAGLQLDAGLTPWLQFGEFLWWFYSSVFQPVGYCAYLNPISIGLGDKHYLQTGDQVVISGVLGCPAANGTWTVTVVDDTHFSIPVAADGAWQPGTGRVRGGSMAFYDSITAAAAQTALGRPLVKFVQQDDDPAINAGADAAFLASRLKDHVAAIRAEVLLAYPQAKFELLYPNDVNNQVCYLGQQGGRLNAAVNLPVEWTTKSGSGFDRFKVEALSWSAQYSNLTLADDAITFATKTPMMWANEDLAYLVPWFNGSCPWPAEYNLASNFVPLVNFWAYDHLALMSWPLPFPTHQRRATFLG